MTTETAAMLTPPKLAQRWGTAAEKVIGLIHDGAIRAINLARNPNGRPRWRIPWEEVLRFEEARASKPPQPKPRRRRREIATSGREYF